MTWSLLRDFFPMLARWMSSTMSSGSKGGGGGGGPASQAYARSHTYAHSQTQLHSHTPSQSHSQPPSQSQSQSSSSSSWWPPFCRHQSDKVGGDNGMGLDLERWDRDYLFFLFLLISCICFDSAIVGVPSYTLYVFCLLFSTYLGPTKRSSQQIRLWVEKKRRRRRRRRREEDEDEDEDDKKKRKKRMKASTQDQIPKTDKERESKETAKRERDLGLHWVFFISLDSLLSLLSKSLNSSINSPLKSSLKSSSSSSPLLLFFFSTSRLLACFLLASCFLLLTVASRLFLSSSYSLTLYLFSSSLGVFKSSVSVSVLR
ncbi:uncharacterized protein ARB_02200 [Trichophyton benhamiae CBS 112371]|uniref:Transmembrane protein n=1 Tax=Arthroderma benhamiae (strain ATCC MYA-4681 / CBS 112371) TaxID=663331 RepID=D4B171_ARTBC|nr:uncharacterized protein ARB_02200 [Trichophyton benhamiae CBS 112371]EFE31006.1 hypothetical protein ARB_02200 [Trichophyton benhamiae CBS 112371]